tara:strand:+ start:209 stop:853 length:645 start_codon:yes stop_codon:yes gene_type:complete
LGKFKGFQRESPLFMDRPKYKKIGYARSSSSTSKFGLEAQVAALVEDGCDQIFQEVISTKVKDSERPQLQAALEKLQEGDELIFCKLDRGFRTQKECVSVLHDLQEQGKHVRTLDGLIDTRGLGKFAPILIGLLSGLGEVERSMIAERKKDSLDYRRSIGASLGGRPKTNKAKEGLVMRLRNEGCSYRNIRDQTGLALATIRRIIVEQEALVAA